MKLHVKSKITIMILIGLSLTSFEVSAQVKLEVGHSALGEIDQGVEGAYLLPEQITLVQSGPDSFESDDTHQSASVINISDPEAQSHNFHDRGDQDWVKFYAVVGKTYLITVDYPEPRCDAVLMVYDRDGASQLSAVDHSGYGEGESTFWTCPADGIYYVMVKQYNESDFGLSTGYYLRVGQLFAFPLGYIKGKVSDALGAGISGAILRSNILNGTALTTPEGYYLMCLPAGTYTVTAEAQGFSPQSRSGITVNMQTTTNLNFSLSAKKGDINRDRNVDIADLIIALRSLVGLETTGLIRDDYVASGADVNGDNKVGMQEAIYILQDLSELR